MAKPFSLSPNASAKETTTTTSKMTPPTWLAQLALLLQLLPLIHATSILFVPETNTTIAVHFPPSSPDDINIFVQAPSWFQYAALGFGDSMAPGTRMLVFYPSDVLGEVTVSPRITVKR